MKLINEEILEDLTKICSKLGKNSNSGVTMISEDLPNEVVITITVQKPKTEGEV